MLWDLLHPIQLVGSTWDTLSRCACCSGCWSWEEDSVPYCPQGEPSLEGELPAHYPALTLSQAIHVPWPRGGDLIIWESRNERCKDELEIQCRVWQVNLEAPPPPGKCSLCTREGQGHVPWSLVAWCGSCTPQSWTSLMSTHAAASNQSETFQCPGGGRPLGLGGLWTPRFIPMRPWHLSLGKPSSSCV